MNNQKQINCAIDQSVRQNPRSNLHQAMQWVSGMTVGSVMVATMVMLPSSLRAENFSLSPKFTPDPKVSAGTASGSATCSSIESLAPKHEVELNRGFGFLRLRLEADSPITVKVVGPGTQECRTGNRFVLAGQWTEGKYRIWVSPAQGGSVNYRVIWSETR